MQRQGISGFSRTRVNCLVNDFSVTSSSVLKRGRQKGRMGQIRKSHVSLNGIDSISDFKDLLAGRFLLPCTKFVWMSDLLELSVMEMEKHMVYIMDVSF